MIPKRWDTARDGDRKSWTRNRFRATTTVPHRFGFWDSGRNLGQAPGENASQGVAQNLRRNAFSALIFGSELADAAFRLFDIDGTQVWVFPHDVPNALSLALQMTAKIGMAGPQCTAV